MDEKTHIVVIDDEEGIRYILRDQLSGYYKHLHAFDSGESFFNYITELSDKFFPDIFLLDLNIPGKMHGLELLKKIKIQFPYTEVIMLTAHSDTHFVVEAVRNGAFDYLLKPCDNEELRITIEKALERSSMIRQIEELKIQLEGRQSLSYITGNSAEIQKLYWKVNKVAGTSFSVLILGESGTGKEVIARAIHEMSERKQKPFVAVDCGAIPPTLMESELFGYEKGAFTGADKRKEGLFEAAHEGTLFLDEIANIPIEMQGKLLRALQERQIMHLGGKQPISIDIRIVSATNLKLEEAIQKGAFRLDLFYRLNEFTLCIPPLRQRLDDIVYLTHRFIKDTGEELNKSDIRISKTALEILLTYPWPGNVRELKNVIRRAVLLADHEIDQAHLIFDILYQKDELFSESPTALPLMTLKEAKKIMETNLIRRALSVCKGNKSEVARILDVDYKSLLTKIREYNIQ